ncbi:MAG: SdpI family protein [Fimbriimonas sp.]
MSLRQSLKWQALIFMATCANAAYLAATLPDRVPTHWNLYGKPDGFGSKWVNVLMGPALVFFILALTLLLPLLSPKSLSISRFAPTFGKLMVIVSALMATLSFVIGQASQSNSSFNMTSVMLAVMFVFFALMGNLMGKVKRNAFVGIRTPWTLADERVWDATHRDAARLWFFGGLAGAVLSLLGVPIVAAIVLICAITFWPVLNSYRLYRRIVG